MNNNLVNKLKEKNIILKERIDNLLKYINVLEEENNKLRKENNELSNENNIQYYELYLKHSKSKSDSDSETLQNKDNYYRYDDDFFI